MELKWLVLLASLPLSVAAQITSTGTIIDDDGCANTFNAASASQADVSSAIGLSSSGDCVNVPAGTATWASGISTTKSISLIGAGIGNTVITRGGGTIITYSPTSNAQLFRVSGFTFNSANGKAIVLNNGSLNPPVYQVRIDHNRFTNSTVVGGAIENFGTRGVADNNTFDTMRGPTRAWGSNVGTGAFEWSNYPQLVFGAANDNFYYEDNTFSISGSVYMVSDCDQGGRYVYRYNAFSATEDMFPWLDYHGGRGALRGCFSGEIYGNTYSRGGFLVSWRGGRIAFFMNSVTSGSGSFNVYTNDGCPSTTPERHNNGYSWLSRSGTTGSLVGFSSSGGDNCGDVVANSTYWLYTASFNGTTGIGAGTLAARPSTCTTGVAYWATNQSVTSLAGMVGVNPSTPISGTLYKCTSTNTWTSYYTPMAYPHPLRGS